MHSSKISSSSSKKEPKQKKKRLYSQTDATTNDQSDPKEENNHNFSLSESGKELEKKIESFKDENGKEALRIIQEKFPKKILDLNEILIKDEKLQKSLKDIHVDIKESENQKHKVPQNELIILLLEDLKAEVLEMAKMSSLVKHWIQLNIPSFEHGNNFGVEIQEETVSELSRAEEAGYQVLEGIAKYHIARAKIISKIKKHPDIIDYRHSLHELDEREYTNVRLCITDLRNNYSILYDMIMKNFEKIKKPRESKALSHMY